LDTGSPGSASSSVPRGRSRRAFPHGTAARSPGTRGGSLFAEGVDPRCGRGRRP
jgi:hypothetical protein